MSRLDLSVLIASSRPGSWTRASSSLWNQTMFVRVPLSAYFFM